MTYRKAWLPALLGAALALSLWPPAQAAQTRTYSDPDDSHGNLDVLRLSGFRVVTRDGIAYRTVITMEDEWLDQEIDLDFNLTERGARWRGCGDDCSGDYYGYINYDAHSQRIRAEVFEATNCECGTFEWPAGRYDSRSIWFDLPESYLYNGTYAFELFVQTDSTRQTEPVGAPLCMTICHDDVDRIQFPTRGRP